ncbi:hypothetical protein OG21DRAFT_1426275 [Imleria badia]|nr:hypothetical protein OG21DRAFT_1426275 [Imleria badia]
MWFQIEDNTMIAYVHRSDMDTAFAHQSRITAAGGVPSPDTYGSLVRCVKDTTDDTSNTLALFAEFQMLGTKPNVYLYHMIISKLTKACKADFALELFQQVTTYTLLHPSSITCGAVIAAWARVGDTVAAEQLFAEMTSQPNCTHILYKARQGKGVILSGQDDRGNVQPSAHTYKVNCVSFSPFIGSDMCCSCLLMHMEPIDVTAMEATFKCVESNPHVHLQGSHWAALINAYCCVLNDTNKAIRVFGSIASHPASQCGPTPLPSAVSYESLINVLVTHKWMYLAQWYIARLQTTGIHMTAYIVNLLIKGYAAGSAIKEACVE